MHAGRGRRRGWGEEMAQTKYTHMNKCINNEKNAFELFFEETCFVFMIHDLVKSYMYRRSGHSPATKQIDQMFRWVEHV
jgi:hypothetical protein